MTYSTALDLVDLLERWMAQRERANLPNHARCAKHVDDDFDFRDAVAHVLCRREK